jgi:tRNA1(Val) A37 N6-methylase TrmN6
MKKNNESNDDAWHKRTKVHANTIETVIQDIKENLKFDIIMTNPPFEEEESDNTKRKLPASYQTRDTALGFLLQSMRQI